MDDQQFFYFAVQELFFLPIDVYPAEDCHSVMRNNPRKKASSCSLEPNGMCVHSMVQNLPGFAYSYQRNTDGTEVFLYASDNVFDTCGLDAKTIQNDLSKLRSCFHSDDFEAFKETIMHSEQKLEKFHIEFRYFHPTKGLIWLSTRSNPARQADGSTIWHGITLDITYRKNVQEMLMQTTIHLTSLLNTIPDLVWMKDTNGKYITCNHAFERFFGTKVDAIIGKTDYDFVEKELADFFLQKDLEAIQKGTISTNEELITYKETGKQGVLETLKAPVYEQNGKLLGVLGIAKDITEQKKAKLELQHQSDLLHSILNSSPNVIMFALDTEYRYLAFNQNHEKTMNALWGKNIGIGLNMLEIITCQDDKQKAKEYFDKALTGEYFVDETSYGKDDSVRSYWQTFYAPIYDDNGIIKGLTCFNLDISEQKKLQENLLLKEFALDKINDAVYLVDENAMFHYVNEAACHALGYSKEELLTMGVVHIDPNVSIERLHNQWKSSKKFITMNSENKRKDGTLFPVEVNPIHFKYNGMSYSLAIVRDITERKRIEEELAKKEEEFRTISEHTPDTIVRFDRECRRIYANPSALRVMGLPQEALLGTNPTDYSPLKDTLLFETTLKCVIQTGEEATLEMEFASAEGHKGWRHLHIVPETNAMGKVTSVLAIGRDISERKKIEFQLRDNETMLQEAQRIAKIGSWKLELTTQAITWSEEMYRIFEIDPQTTRSLRKLFIEMIHPEDMAHVKKLHYQARKNHTPYETTHRVVLKNGTLKYIHAKAMTYHDAHRNAVSIMGTVQDVTEHKMVEKQVEFLAHHDTLTELPNRMLARSRCEQSIAYAKRNGSKVALLFIDLDGFKTINDSLGHAFGDKMLKMVANRLKKHIRQTDTISRQGGDEFLMILTDVHDVDDISIMAQKLLDEFKKPFQLDTHSISSSLSIGITLYPDDGQHFDGLLQCADTAMYKAKDAGRNTYCFFTEAMNQEIFEHLYIQNDLKQALAEQQFVLHYQPQIHLETNKISGVEALVRWQHPTKGLIPPMRFIPIAESTGLILDIGEWVIHEACRQAATWHQQGMFIIVAVNISAVQFKRGNLEHVIEKALKHSGLNPEYLELELTESVLIHDTENVLQAIRRLKNLGIKLSIDDFGTGYSSLSYLKRFAVNKLKIDQSFVRDILKDQEDNVIVKAIIQMAKSLGLKTIAEGVETQDVVNLVQDYGCDEVQGYYFAKPMPHDEFLAYCKKQGFTLVF